MRVIFKIPGEPKGKGRPRFSAKTNIVYTPADTAAYEYKVRKCYAQQCRSHQFADDDRLQMYITARYKIPESASQKRRGMMLANKLRPAKTPDADNIIKIVCDALNKVAYKDDKQIVDVQLRKLYGAEPCVDVMICTAGDFVEV